MEKSNNKNSENQKKKAKTNDKHKPSHKDWKFIVPKEGEPKSKKVNDKMHYYCNKPHGREGKTMWALHKQCDHKDYYKFKADKSKQEKVDLELKDDLRSLLFACNKDFV